MMVATDGTTVDSSHLMKPNPHLKVLQQQLYSSERALFCNDFVVAAYYLVLEKSKQRREKIWDTDKPYTISNRDFKW